MAAVMTMLLQGRQSGTSHQALRRWRISSSIMSPKAVATPSEVRRDSVEPRVLLRTSITPLLKSGDGAQQLFGFFANAQFPDQMATGVTGGRSFELIGT